MSVHRILSGLVLTVAAFSPACSVETADEQMSDNDLFVPLDPMGGPSDPQDDPPGSGNGFGPECLKSALPALRKYGVQRLWNSPMGSTFGTLPANPELNALPSTCRKAVLKYAMRCALPRDTFAVDPLDNNRYWGWLDITKTWRNTPLSSTPDDQWWFTACIYQHLNGLNTEVPILLDGYKAGLYSTLLPHSTFKKRDSRIWGNLFTATGDFYPNVCYETDLLTSCEEFAAVDTRLCDSDPTLNCYLNIVGPCSAACTYSTQGAYCGSGGMKNIGSRLKDFTMYGTICQ
jgi:hypothetical protein